MPQAGANIPLWSSAGMRRFSDRRGGKKTGIVPFKQIFFSSVKILSQTLLPLSSVFISLLPFTSIQRGGKVSCWLLLSKVGHAKASKAALPRS